MYAIDMSSNVSSWPPESLVHRTGVVGAQITDLHKLVRTV